MLNLIDVENWERKTHFEYYTKTLKCGYSLTATIDVTDFLRHTKEKGLRFYPSFFYCIAYVVNQTKEFRMGLDEEGRPGYWEKIHPVHTIFHEDDKTFSDIWTHYDEKFEMFYHNLITDIDEYKDIKGIKTKPEQPRNFFCVSCTPWLHYDGYSTNAVGGTPNLFPIINFGKYRAEGGRQLLPLTVTISHAAADGYHTSKFFADLQQRLEC